jgi:glycosyltransferase involved in cell wall biosynthesis
MFTEAPDQGGLAPVGDDHSLGTMVLERLAAGPASQPAADDGREGLLEHFSEAAILNGIENLYQETVDAHVGRSGRPKLCYVLPKFDAATEEHFFHTYQLLAALSKLTDLTVIVERTVGVPHFGSARVLTQRRTRLPPLRLLEILTQCWKARRDGCRCFYVHYSFFGAVAAFVVTRALGGRLFYWHCVSAVFTKRGWSREAVAHRLKAEWPLRATFRMIDTLVTGSRSVAAFYARRFGLDLESIRIVPNEIDPQRFQLSAETAADRRRQLGLAPGDRVVLFLHRIAPRKGAHYLPEIAREVCAEDPRAHFVVVGNGPAFPALQAAVDADPLLRARVHLVGWMPNREVPSFYAVADVFVMPSEEEGFPRVLLEAMAAGVPFVASDVGGVRDITTSAQSWGILPVGAVRDFATAITALLQDRQLHASLAAEGRQVVTRFTVEAVARRTVEQLGLSTAVRALHADG